MVQLVRTYHWLQWRGEQDKPDVPFVQLFFHVHDAFFRLRVNGKCKMCHVWRVEEPPFFFAHDGLLVAAVQNTREQLLIMACQCILHVT